MQNLLVYNRVPAETIDDIDVMTFQLRARNIWIVLVFFAVRSTANLLRYVHIGICVLTLGKQ